MLTSRVFRPARRMTPGLLAALIALCLLVTTALPAFAGNVRISDPVQVLNVSQVTAAGAKLPYDLDIYTTNTYTGSSSDFVNRTVSAHLTSKSLIVIAIDTTHRYLAIVGGKNVPLSTSQYNSAGSAFKNAVAGNHYTNATIAAIQSLASSLKSSSSSSSSSPLSGLAILIIIIVIVGLIIIGAIFRFIRRLLGFAPPPRQERQREPHYGDGRDNLGGGTAGSF
ncbi:MAG TPA: hypothetical protein VHD63_21590 [Ktedonobacteraceae bacterium]|nr:hypothetical protein [Ktedonobacteraceae bacterium]